MLRLGKKGILEGCACSFVSVSTKFDELLPLQKVFTSEKWQKKICSGDAKAKAASIISSPQNLFQPPGLIHRGQNSSVLCLKFRRRKEKSMRRSIMRNKFCSASSKSLLSQKWLSFSDKTFFRVSSSYYSTCIVISWIIFQFFSLFLGNFFLARYWTF